MSESISNKPKESSFENLEALRQIETNQDANFYCSYLRIDTSYKLIMQDLAKENRNRTQAFLMTPSQKCKSMGLRSFKEMVTNSQIDEDVLLDWHKHMPHLFECAAYGAIATRHMHRLLESEPAKRAGKAKRQRFFKAFNSLKKLTSNDREHLSEISDLIFIQLDMEQTE